MEGYGVDDLYGDLSQDQYCSLATGNEDSLDIYSGLDTPRSNGETCSIASPQLTESMDLYEEIITEEQRSIQSAQNELKKRFVAAQNQVEELRLRLQQMETQNTALNTENSCLKKNICALIKTARMEIVRKDEEIKRLSQRSGRAYTPRVNGTKDPVSTRLNSLGPVRSSGPSRAPPPIKPPGPRVDSASKDWAPPAHPSLPPSSAPPIKPPGPKVDCASKDGAPPAHPSPLPSSAPPPIKPPGPRVNSASKDGAPPAHPSLPPSSAPPIKPPGPKVDCASKDGAPPAHPSPLPSSAPPPIKPPGPRVNSASKDGAPPAHPSLPPSSAPPIKPPGPKVDCASKDGAPPAHPSPLPSSAPPPIKPPGPRVDSASKDGAPPAHPSPPPSSAPPPIKPPGPRIGCTSKDAAHPPTPHPPTPLPRPPPPLSSLPPPPSSAPPLPPSAPPPPLQPPCKKRENVIRHSDASDSRPPPDVDSKYSTIRDYEVPLKQTGISIGKVSTDSAPGHNLLERHKQPSHKDGKSEHCRTSEERRHKNAVDPLKESQAEERNRSHKTHRESRRHDSMSRKDKHRSPDIEVDKRSAKSKSPPPESGNGMVLSAHKSSKTVTEPHSKRCGRDLRHDKNGDDRSCKDLSSSRRSQEEVGSIRRSLTERSSEPLDHRRGASLSSDHRRKEERQRKDDAKRRERRSPVMETREEHEQKHKKEREGRKKAPDSKEEKSTSRCLDVPPGEHKPTEKVTVEENSPNRKLSFMETLNLTLSPVKKPRGLSGSKDQGSCLPEEEMDDSSVECCDQLDMEDFCVIDEVHSDSMEMNSSQSAVEISKTLMDDPKQVTSDAPMSLDPAGMERLKSGEKPSEKGDRSEAVTDPKAINETLNDSLRCDVEPSKVTEDPHNPKSLDNRCVSTPDSELVMERNLPRVNVRHDVESKDLTTDACLTDSQEDTQVCPSTDRKKIPDKPEESIGLPDSCGLNLNDEPSSVLISKNHPSETIAQDAVDTSREMDLTAKDGKAKINQSQQLAFPNQPKGVSIQLSPSCSSSESNEKTSSLRKDGSSDADVVSSTISIEVPSQNDLACEPYAEVTLWDNAVDGPVHEHSSPLGSIAVSRVSSTTEEVLPLENLNTCSLQSPKGSRNADSCYTNNREATSSIPLLCDEESMMKTLNSLKIFPDPVSPLTSPIRITRKNQLHSQSNKPAHVKSLGKDFSTVVVDATTAHLGVNKENKNPGGFTKSMTKSQSEDELEEGEILSESDEEQCPVTSQAKRPTATDRPSPQPSSRLGKRGSAKLLAASQESPKTIRKNITPSNGSPSLNRSRHKTICLPTAATSVLNTEEVMDMIGKIRHQVRKKYMKLNKTFHMSSFYGIIDNALVSFLDFVDRINLSKFCDHADDLKSRLKNIMSSVLNKISKNGIVNRIFEQQSECLKKKLWNFVDVQLDFMFKDIRAALASVCKAKKENVHSRADTGEKSSKNKSTKPLRSPATITSRPKSPVTITSRPKSQLGKSPVTITSRPKSKLGKSPVTMISRPKSQQKKSLMTMSSRPKMRQLKSPVSPISRPRVRQKMDESNTKRTTSVGLGSRGKNIKMTFEKEEEETSSPNTSDHPSIKNTAEKTLQNTHSTSAKEAALVRRISRSNSLHDKSDFQILTEQQTSSLTFNLVTDTQMGDIFKCLLDGSDLLDTSIPSVDCHSWPVGTPRKECPAGEPLLSITTPTKVCLPSKLIATWSAISPRKMSPSPNGKLHLPVNPVLFDESCMLEVPSGLAPSSGVFSQRSSYSILAEDLAVSLTIPSPLKSDSHLSFLQPVNGEPTSAPDSVISAHFSEDALLEEEDATEQDIHLALDTDNSSCGSSDGRSREAAGPLLFHFKPHLPMQAVVMEKSNDHFIVKIRQAATSACIPPSDEENRTEMPAGEEQRSEGYVITPAPAVGEGMGSSSEDSSSRCPPDTETVNVKAVLGFQSEATGEDTDDRHTKTCCYPDRNEREARTGTKRKKDREESKAKRLKEEVHSGSKQKAFKHSKERRSRTSRKDRNKASSPTVQLSPNSLSAKNIIKKKGEVVVMWTKDEDRAILLELKMRKSSRDAFSALSDKLNKTPAQIAERFGQLMKLFKKKEKMTS